MKRIYLDNAAATPIDDAVLTAMMPYLTTKYGNPSSLHYFGQEARAAVQQARQQVAQCLGVKGGDIVFTSGGTEADNLAVLGYLRANFPKGGHIITSSIEHHAILRTFQALAKQGYDVTFLPVDRTGRVSASDVQQALRDDTVLVSIMYANNETGMIQPIDEIAKFTHERGIAFHVDAVQAFGYIPIRPLTEHIDMLTLCSHKIYGPKGVGALYIRQGLQVAAEAYGGPQEHRLRAGTENVPAIVGFGKAAELLASERAKRSSYARMLKDAFYTKLIQGNEAVQFHGTLDGALPNILNFSVCGATSDIVLIALDRLGVAVSAGSACEAGAVEPSHVLQAMGVGDEWLRSSIRVSLGKENTIEEIEDAVRAFRTVLERIQ